MYAKIIQLQIPDKMIFYCSVGGIELALSQSGKPILIALSLIINATINTISYEEVKKFMAKMKSEMSRGLI